MSFDLTSSPWTRGFLGTLIWDSPPFNLFRFSFQKLTPHPITTLIFRNPHNAASAVAVIVLALAFSTAPKMNPPRYNIVPFTLDEVPLLRFGLFIHVASSLICPELT